MKKETDVNKNLEENKHSLNADPKQTPTLEGFFLLAAKLHGHNSHIFEQHRLITNTIKHNRIIKLHCIAGGIVTEFMADDGKQYKLTLEEIDESKN